MFKKENEIWLYLIGCLIFFGVLIYISRDLLIPIIYNQKPIIVETDFQNAPEKIIDNTLDYYARLETNYGTILFNLFEDNTPNNVNNFVYLSNNNYYDNTKFHRLISNFLIQGGDRNTLNDDLTDDGKGRTGYLIKDEINWDSLDLSIEKRNSLTSLGYSSTPNLESKPLKRFSLVMASSGPDTNSSQFFIVISAVDDSRLDELNGKFSVIGEVISGGDILEEISDIPTISDATGNFPRPTQDIVIEDLEIYTR